MQMEIDEEPDEPEDIESMNEQLNKAYAAGFLDSSSTIHAPVTKDDDYSIGYNIYSEIKITRSLPFGLQKIDDFCMNNGIRSNIREKDGSFQLVIRREQDVEMFLKKLYPFLRDRREEAELMVNRIIPAIKNGMHTEKETFLDMMCDVDQLREMNPHVTRSKYTLEYFEEEFEQ